MQRTEVKYQGIDGNKSLLIPPHPAILHFPHRKYYEFFQSPEDLYITSTNCKKFIFHTTTEEKKKKRNYTDRDFYQLENCIA